MKILRVKRKTTPVWIYQSLYMEGASFPNYLVQVTVTLFGFKIWPYMTYYMIYTYIRSIGLRDSEKLNRLPTVPFEFGEILESKYVLRRTRPIGPTVHRTFEELSFVDINDLR
jgi:hypothetical protein